MSENAKGYMIIDLGGSILVPNGGPNVQFLKEFKPFILNFLQEGRRFIIVSGGGTIARHYQEAAEEIVEQSYEEKDWIGIHATRLNAQWLRAVFYEQAHPYVIDGDPHEDRIRQKLVDMDRYRLFVASGWKPGNSTDYVSMVLAKFFGAQEVIVATKVSYVYDEDIEKNGNAQPIKKISWANYRKLASVGNKWIPGMKCPVDPVAARFAEAEGIRAIVVLGTDLDNLGKVIRGEEFKGSVIG